MKFKDYLDEDLKIKPRRFVGLFGKGLYKEFKTLQLDKYGSEIDNLIEFISEWLQKQTGELKGLKNITDKQIKIIANEIIKLYGE